MHINIGKEKKIKQRKNKMTKKKEIHERWYSIFIKKTDCSLKCQKDCDALKEIGCYISFLENKLDKLEEKYFKD
jgi:hypothetical protein